MSDNQQQIKLPEGLDVETARDVLREFGTTDDATIISEDALDALREEIQEAKDAFAAVLAEESPQSAETLARQDMDALTEPFRDDDGDIDVDTLRQDPQTGDTSGGDNDGDGAGDGPVDIDSLSRDQAEELRKKREKITTFQTRDMDGRVDALQQEIADELNAESYEDVEADLEVL